MNLTDISSGLTSEYVAIHHEKKRKKGNKSLMLALEILKGQVSSIFFVLLLCSAILSFILGSIVDGWIFVIINLISVLLGFIQEFRASKASQLLESLISHEATVKRDGLIMKVASGDIVEGDICIVVSGDVLVADVLVRESFDAFVDMSVLTGESLPIEVIADQKLLAGCSLASGRMTVQVVSSAEQNSLTAYSDKLSSIKKNNSFTRFVSNISMQILLLALVSIFLVGFFGLVVYEKYTISEFILYAISMLVGVVPESLPLIITLMLTRESLAMYKEKVLVKRLSALQQLGSIKYLLTDKTGTLTENSIRVNQIFDVSDLTQVADAISLSEYNKSPMDAAFDTAIIAHNNTVDTNTEQPTVTPFKSTVGYASFEFDNTTIIRGQYNAVITASNISPEERKRFDEQYVVFESQGLRAIAFASKKAGESQFVFNGMYVFEDPLKEDAIASYHAIKDMGIDVKILTGDSALVSTYIGKKLNPDMTENSVCSLDKIKVEDSGTTCDIYARCQPDHKLALIDIYEKKGAVGFLGEGINDALALKRADVGMVVYNASDVARQSADIFLMEKGLKPILTAISMSRKVYAHIFTYLLCTLTGNIGTLFSLTVVTLFWVDIPMLPIQILLNNLLTDIPLMFLISDNLSKEEYDKPVEHSPREFFKKVALFAFISSVFDMTYFFLFNHYDIEIFRTGWFVFSVLCELVLVLTLRGKTKMSLSLKIALLSAGALAIALPYLPVISTAFALYPLNPVLMASLAILLVAYFVVNQIVKKVSMRT
ncbi:MAG: HAD-IC family P-type ATPase [Patescibacteria group bacterium]